jgi:pyruvate dehydrogenase E1 component alpha subunit
MLKKRQGKYSREFLSNLYSTMYRIRVFERRCMGLFRQGMIRGYLHPYLGEEAIATGVCAALLPRDYLASTHRGHGHCIARGGDLKKMVAEITGRATGYCGGRGGSMHIADMESGNLGANGIVGAGIPLGAGAALGAWIRGEDRVAAVFASDGAANNGAFCEGLNLAGVWSLPLLVVVENNQYAVSTPIESSTREPELYRRSLGFGVKGFRVDGNDVLKVYEKAADCVGLCRRGEGPVLLEAVTYRQGGHHINDPGTYMPRDRLEHYRKRDPLAMGRRFLLEMGRATEEEVKEMEAQVEREMDEAVAFADRSPQPSLDAFLREVESY